MIAWTDRSEDRDSPAVKSMVNLVSRTAEVLGLVGFEMMVQSTLTVDKLHRDLSLEPCAADGFALALQHRPNAPPRLKYLVILPTANITKVLAALIAVRFPQLTFGEVSDRVCTPEFIELLEMAIRSVPGIGKCFYPRKTIADWRARVCRWISTTYTLTPFANASHRGDDWSSITARLAGIRSEKACQVPVLNYDWKPEPDVQPLFLLSALAQVFTWPEMLPLLGDCRDVISTLRLVSEGNPCQAVTITLEHVRLAAVYPFGQTSGEPRFVLLDEQGSPVCPVPPEGGWLLDQRGNKSRNQPGHGSDLVAALHAKFGFGYRSELAAKVPIWRVPQRYPAFTDVHLSGKLLVGNDSARLERHLRSTQFVGEVTLEDFVSYCLMNGILLSEPPNGRFPDLSGLRAVAAHQVGGRVHYAAADLKLYFEFDNVGTETYFELNVHYQDGGEIRSAVIAINLTLLVLDDSQMGWTAINPSTPHRGAAYRMIALPAAGVSDFAVYAVG